MVVDTSVVILILYREKGWEEAVALLGRQERRLISAASLVEAQAVVAGRHKPGETKALERLDAFVVETELEIVPLTLKHSRIAREAYLLYGKGQGHPAALNYGDVMSYALAKATGETLAFVGDDFQHTDLKTLRLPHPS